MAFPILAAAGLVGSLFSASKQVKAAKRAADTIREAALRYGGEYRALAGRSRAELEPFQRFLQAQYGSKLGKDDPRLKMQYGQNLQAIGRQTTRELGKSRVFWGATGGSGSRGEELRIQRAGTEAAAGARLGYGEAQNRYQEINAGRYGQGLQSLIGYGQQATNLEAQGINMEYGGVTGAAGMKGQATSDFYGGMSGMLGTIAGQSMGDYYQNRYEKMYGSGAAGAPTSATSMAGGAMGAFQFDPQLELWEKQEEASRFLARGGGTGGATAFDSRYTRKPTPAKPKRVW